jgi:arginine N-succinyltransferase
MGMFPERFESHVIAELLPPFNEDGSSPLWEAFGKRFTQMKYHEADKLSRSNKDFIKNLFPQEDIYICLLEEQAQSVVGHAGKESQAAKKLLERIGLSYLDAVDPFDGGPHYGAKLQEVSLIKRKKNVQLSSTPLSTSGNRGLLGFSGKNGFGCLSLHYKEVDDSKIEIEADPKKIIEDFEPDTNSFVLSPLV